MKKNFVAAAAAFALLGAASAASATTFTGSYATSTYTNGSNGLAVFTQDATPGPGTGFSFNLNSIGASSTFSLFRIYTNESTANSDDLSNANPISVTFNFTAPSAATGSVTGDTGAETVPVTFFGHLIGSFSEGYVDWDNGGDTTLNFGSFGQLQVHLDDATFGAGSVFNPAGLDEDPSTVKATFTLKAAVPEPMTWALMLMGFGGLGAALRANRRQGAALTAA